MIKRFLLALSLLVAGPAWAQNAGFETGTTTGWTTSNNGGTKAPTGWTGDGSGVTITTGMQNFCPGGGYCWTVTPYGTYMLAIQPGVGSVGFDSMTGSLGLSAASTQAIKDMLIAQSQTGGGDPTPTNASWVKRTMTLQAGVTYTFAWQYISTDYTPFNDGSIITLTKDGDPSVVGNLNGENKQYALLGFTNPGTGNYSTNSYGSTGWQVAQFTVPADGSYTLGFGAFNLGDTILSPILLIDEVQGETLLNGQTFTPIDPNPGSVAPPPPPSGPTLCCGGSDASFSAKVQHASAVASFSLTNKAVTIIDQIGHSNLITVEQLGTRKNYAKYVGNGNGNTVNIYQNGTAGTEANYVDLAITGSNNTVSFNQTSTGGSKGIFATVNNNSNSVTVAQSNNGNHYLDLTLNGGNKTVSVTQQGSAAHMAKITLDGLATGLSLTQTGGTQQFYSITHSCATAGGCGTITVTQGQ